MRPYGEKCPTCRSKKCDCGLHPRSTISKIALAMELDADEGYDLPSNHEELPRWGVESPSPRIEFNRLPS